MPTSVRVRSRARAARVAFALAALAFAAAPVRDARAAEPDYESLLAERAPAIVTIKFVMKSSDWESTNDVLGTLVDPSGLVLTSNGQLGGGETRIASIKVLLGADPTEHETIVVARDGVLGLAYLQVLAPPDGKPLPFIDLAKGVDPKVGQSLFGVARHRAEFDFAPSILRLYLTSRVETPRGMWNFAGDFGHEGLPVFDLDGRPVGVIARQNGSEGADEHGSDTFVLPLKDVRRSIDQAKKRVADAVAKAKEAKEPEKDDAKAPAKDGATKPPEPAPGPAPAPAPDPKPSDPKGR